LESPTNLGYFPAARFGLEQYLKRADLPNWIIICNNDITIPDKQFFSRLFDHDRAAAVIAPAIVPELTGIDCNPFLWHRPSALLVARCRLLLSTYWLSGAVQALAPSIRILRDRFRFWRRRRKLNEPAKVYAAHGAFIIFSRRFFDAGGYVDD